MLKTSQGRCAAAAAHLQAAVCTLWLALKADTLPMPALLRRGTASCPTTRPAVVLAVLHSGCGGAALGERERVDTEAWHNVAAAAGRPVTSWCCRAVLTALC